MPPQTQNGAATREFYDVLGPFSEGVDGYKAPLLLDKTTLSSALNTTVRGDYVTVRPVFRKIAFDQTSQALLNGALAQGVYQAGVYFKPDSQALGPTGNAEGIANVIAGRLISIFPDPNVNTAKALEITSWLSAVWVNGNAYNAGVFASYTLNGITTDYQALNTLGASTIPPPNDPANWKPQNLPNGQNWVWQSEMFLIWNDGASNPVFYNTNTGTATRSNYGIPIPYGGSIVATAFTVNAPGTPTDGGGGGVHLTSIIFPTPCSNMQVGDTLTFTSFGQMTVLSIVDSTHVILNNINIRTGTVIHVTGGVYWTEVTTNQLPPGRMGTYGMGRNWISAVNGVQFFASDGVGGASGTQANQFRDAPLNVTENAFLAGGGYFLVPGASGSITAMRFVANLDVSLGQGPLQVFTTTLAFSCQTPVDRLTWQDVNNPILTESIKGYGATGQNTTINVNSDLLFRSVIGLSSQILARRDFDTWGNVPISTEVSQVTDQDNQTLLPWGSSILFDNRVLWTCTPTQTAQGVLHSALIPLNLDPISSLRGKEPTVYDSLRWTGLNVFQLFVGSFANRERAFAVCFNNITKDVELYEILPDSNSSYLDNDITRITWAFNSASMFKDTAHIFKRLEDGEIYVDILQGQVDFQAWYKPDQWPCFIPWLAWTECQSQPYSGVIPGFRPRMGLGPPSAQGCDLTNNRDLRCFYTCDLRFVITGQCRFLGGRFKANRQDEPEFAPANCANQALLAAMKSIGSGPGGGTPPGPNVTVVVDFGGNIISDAGGNVLLG